MGQKLFSSTDKLPMANMTQCMYATNFSNQSGRDADGHSLSLYVDFLYATKYIIVAKLMCKRENISIRDCALLSRSLRRLLGFYNKEVQLSI